MYRGFYINLARDQQRRQSLTEHLQRMGVASRYERFEAVDGRAVAQQHSAQWDPGHLGCWLSHLNVLRENRSSNVHLHIIEDDTVFSSEAVGAFELLLKHCDQQGAQWDLMYTDVFLTPELRTFLQFSEAVQIHQRTNDCRVMSLAKIPFAGTSSYLVNKQSLEKCIELLQGNSAAMLPVDLYLRGLVEQKKLKAMVTVPFLTTISPESWNSSISNSRDTSQMASYLLRQAFYLEADREALLAEMRRMTEGINLPTLQEFYLQFVKFYLSDRWVDF